MSNGYHINMLQTPSNKKIEVMTVASNYHIEVNPNDAGIYDRIVIQEMIKTIAQTQQLDITGQREFKGHYSIKCFSISQTELNSL